MVQQDFRGRNPPDCESCYLIIQVIRLKLDKTSLMRYEVGEEWRREEKANHSPAYLISIRLGTRTTANLRCERPSRTVPQASRASTVESMQRCERHNRITITGVRQEASGQETAQEVFP